MDLIDRLTGHTGRLENRPGATEYYIANNADDNRKMFEEINITMLGNEALHSKEHGALDDDLGTMRITAWD